MIPDGSNILTGERREYTAATFLSQYPQFDEPTIPQALLTAYLELAQEAIQEARWHQYWPTAIGLFIAHLCTLWLQGAAGADASAAEALKSGSVSGVISSKSVSGVSVSYDTGSVLSDFAGSGSWKLTVYGQQLLTLLKIAGKGGMQIW